MLQVELSAWIIEDGNYDEFEVGGAYRFALEFYADGIAVDPEPHSEPRLSPVGKALYDASGEIIFRSESAWAVDFGVPAYQASRPPDWAKIGTRVRGRVHIGVDPYFYLEFLESEQGMPNLFRQWLVHRIFLETTPWLEPQTGKPRTRDATRESFEEISATDTRKHGVGGVGHYVLECEMRSDLPSARGPFIVGVPNEGTAMA